MGSVVRDCVHVGPLESKDLRLERDAQESGNHKSQEHLKHEAEEDTGDYSTVQSACFFQPLAPYMLVATFVSNIDKEKLDHYASHNEE